MAIVTSDFLAGLFTNFHVIWQDAFLAAANQVKYERFTTIAPSNTDTESYAWMGTVPKMREWIDVRALGGLDQFNYTIRNKHYEVSLEVDRDMLEDDKYGQIRPRIQQLGAEAARFPAELITQTLAGGGANAAYDGSNFFSATHTEGGQAAQSNTITGTGTTLAQVRADLISARSKMRRFYDGRARVMNLAPDLVIVPPELQDVFEQLVNTNLIALASGTQMGNVLQGAVDIIVDSNLTDVNDWYLLATAGPMKPIIFQTRKAAEFVAVDNPADAMVFSRRTFWYGVDARFNAGFGPWQMAVRVTN